MICSEKEPEITERKKFGQYAKEKTTGQRSSRELIQELKAGVVS